jgi:crotonobetainyl-CoA:carnitine CoA-transferase CaiB-like acyl-CoA transferase
MDNAIAPFGVFRTKDSTIVLAIGNDKQWNNFTKFLLKNDARFNNSIFATNSLRVKNLKKLKHEIESAFKSYRSKDIVSILEKISIPCGQVKTMLDVLDDKENYDEKLLEKITHPVAGNIIVPSGGIFFSNHKKTKYRIAPKLKQTGKYGK